MSQLNHVQDSNENCPTGLDCIRELVMTNIKLIRSTHQAGIEAGLRSPVVFLCELADVHGGRMAREFVGDESVDDRIAATRLMRLLLGVIATWAYAFDIEEARKRLLSLDKTHREWIDGPTVEGQIRIVVLALGGVTGVDLRLPQDA